MSFKKIVNRFGLDVVAIIFSIVSLWWCWSTLKNVNDKASEYMRKEKKTFTIIGRDSYDVINRNGFSENVKTFRLKSNGSIGELTIFVSDDVYEDNLDKDTYTTRLSKKDIDKAKHVESPYYGTIAILLSVCVIVCSIFFFRFLYEFVTNIYEYFFK